jgi:hypothetical protein
MDGMLVANGAGILPRAPGTPSLAPTPQLFDLAPTILQLFGEPIPADMDGRVLQELLVQPSGTAYAPAEAFENKMDGEYSREEEKAIEERLAGLGYLG